MEGKRDGSPQHFFIVLPARKFCCQMLEDALQEWISNREASASPDLVALHPPQCHRELRGGDKVCFKTLGEVMVFYCSQIGGNS